MNNDLQEWLSDPSRRAWPDNTLERLAYYTGVSLSSIQRWAKGGIPVDNKEVIWRLQWLKACPPTLWGFRLLGWIPNHRQTLAIHDLPRIARAMFEPLDEGYVRLTVTLGASVRQGLCLHLINGDMGIIPQDRLYLPLHPLAATYPYEWFQGPVLESMTVFLFAPDFIK